jgi:hypothetical protein
MAILRVLWTGVVGVIRPIDKYLVERYFENTGISALMIFAARFALLIE